MSSRHRARAVLVTLAALFSTTVSAAPPAAAVSSSAAVAGVPSAPGHLTTRAGVDGVFLSWWRGAVTASTPAPTSYVVRRRAEGHDLAWVVAASDTSTSWSTSDTTAPAGLPVTYTVAARRSGADSPESVAAEATVPTWDGPYSPARRALTMVWDEAEGGPSTGRETTQATADSSVPLSQGWANGLMGFAAGPGSLFALPLDTPDGEYTVGQGEGLLPVSVRSGARCSAPNGAPPSGTAAVRRTAPSLFGYAAISVDADLVCGDGHRLRAELRWSTPEDVHRLETAPMTVLQTAPGELTTRDVTVTNAGSTATTLGAARLVDADLSTAAPLAVTGSTCEGRTMAPGQSCDVTVTHTAGTAGSVEGNAFLVVSGDLGDVELGRIVGQQPPALSGAQNVTVTGAPGRVNVTWTHPRTLDDRLIDSWRVEEDADPTPKVLYRAPYYGTSARVTGLAVGRHSLRVVLRTDDGREISTAPIAVNVPRRWLLVATRDGVRALDPEGVGTDGGLFGPASSAVGVSMSPSRDQVVVAYGPFAGSVGVLTPTGDRTRTLTIQPEFGDRDPAVSRDGQKVVVHRLGYTGAQFRESSLVLVPTAGGTETVVPASVGLWAPSWTPDGTTLVAEQISGAEMVKVAVASGARTPLRGTAGGRSPSVSRSGRVAYISRTPEGDEIRLTSLSGGAGTRVGVHDGLWDLEWDPSGRWLAATGGPYESPEHTYVYDVSAKPTLVRTIAGGSAVTWLDTASVAPEVTLNASAWSQPSASLAVGASDADDALGGLHRECRLDSATTWTTCGSTWSLSGLAPGRHTAYARATDPSGQSSTVATRTWTVDGTAPTATLGSVPTALTAATTTVSWTVSDSGSGPASYDVRQRSASISGRLGGYVHPAAWQAMRTRSLALRLVAGSQYCWSVRAHDVAGNAGAWSAERCTSVAVDDRAMTASAGWTRGTSTSHAYGTWSRAQRSAATLTRASVQGRRIAVVADTCPSCGAVDVVHAGQRLGRISLYSAKTAHRQIRWLAIQPATRSGTVVVRTTSSKPVYLDGIVVAH